MDDVFDDEVLARAQAPRGFKRYETRDRIFSAHNGPNFIKGRFPDAVMGVRIHDRHCNFNRAAHGGLLRSFVDTVP